MNGELSEVREMAANIVITSDPISGQTVLQIEPNSQLSSLFQTSALLDITSELSFVIQSDSIDSIHSNELTFNARAAQRVLDRTDNNGNSHVLAVKSVSEPSVSDAKRVESEAGKRFSQITLPTTTTTTSTTTSKSKTTTLTPVLCSEDDNDNEDKKSNASLDDDKLSAKCKVCSLRFESLSRLRKHAKSHAEDKPFKCNACDQCFNFEINLRLHVCAVHQPKDTKPSCCECGKSFTRIASLKSHIIVHQKDEMLVCSECCDEFVSQYYLKKHFASVHMKKRVNKDQQIIAAKRIATQVFRCALCDQKFSMASQLREHNKMHVQIKSSLKHRTYNKGVDRTNFNHVCNTCGKSFKKNSQLVRHVRIHTGEKPFVCEYCNKAFNQKNSLDIHKTKHTGERKFKCKFCSAKFNQSGNMRSHIKRLHAPQADTPASQLHKCPFCNCVFKKVGILNCHISRRHSQENLNNSLDIDGKRVEKSNCLTPSVSADKDCNNIRDLNGIHSKTSDEFSDLLSKALENSGVTPSCDQMSNNKEVLNIFDPATGARQTHIVRRVGKISYRQCLYCQKEFKKSSDLVRHVRIHTCDKPFKCNQCFRAFTVKGTLSAHMRTHDGIKPFICSTCDKPFSSSQSLKVHSRLHTGVTPYPCNECEKMFRTLGHLKSHLLTHQRQQMQASNTNNNSNRNKAKNVDDSILSKIQLQGPIMVVNSNHDNQITNCVNLIPNNLQDNQFMPLSNSTQLEVDHLGRPKRKYRCVHCDKAFKKSSHLTQHIRSHTGEKPFQCETCSQCFVAKGSLKTHLQVHSGLKPYKCGECLFAFSTRGSLTRHMARHRDVRPFMCPYCQKTFKSSLNCKKHIKLHRTEFALQLIKEQQSSAYSENIRHSQIIQIGSQIMANVERQTDKDMTLLSPTVEDIPLLQLNGNNSIDINDAVNVDHNMHSTLPVEPLQTSYYESIKDGQYFEATLPLSVNISDNEPILQLNQTADDMMFSSNPTTKTQTIDLVNTINQELRPYTCEICGTAFKKAAHLKQHIRRHTGEKPFECQMCSRTFASRGVLNAHKNTHLAVKKYRCEQCGTTFATNNSLRRHMNTIHKSIVFKCPHCSLQLKSELLLNKHINSAHTEQTISSISKSLYEAKSDLNSGESQTDINLCEEQNDVWNKEGSTRKDNNKFLGFDLLDVNNGSETLIKRSNDSLNTTQRQSKSITYANQCDFCPKSFKKPSDLTRHRRIHTGEKPYVCDICSKSFTVKSTLDSHLITHKGERNFKCETCDASFVTNGSLKVHMRLHTGDKPFKCTLCDAKFRTSGHRKAHIEKHNKQKSKNNLFLNNSQQIIAKPVELNQNITIDGKDINENNGMDNEIVKITLSTNTNQSGNITNTYQIDASLLSQLFQMDSTLIQQFQSQGIIISSDGDGENSLRDNDISIQQIFR